MASSLAVEWARGRRARGLLAGAALLCVGCDTSRENAKRAEPAPVAIAAPLIPGWAAGKRFEFAGTLKSKLLLTGQQLMGLDLATKLGLETRQVGPETEFFAQLLQPKFQADTPEAQAQFEALAKELEQPFGFAMAQGKLTSLRLPAAWSPFAVSIARTIAAGLQLAAGPTDKRDAGWKASEVDATGKYDVEYAPVNGDARLLSKHKLRYASVSLGKITLGQFATSVAPQVIESKGSVRLGADAAGPQLELVEYHEKLKMQLTPTSLVDSETALRLVYERLAPPSAPLDWATVLANTKQLAPDDVPITRTPTTSYDAQRIGDYTFDKALRELVAQARDPERSELLKAVGDKPFAPNHLKEREAKLQQQGRAFTALAALIRSDKKNVPLAVAGVRARSPALRGLLDALASAGTAEAQAALVSLMNEAKLDLALRRAVASSLMRTERATPESVRALEAHIGVDDTLHVFALYGLGTIARRLKDAGEAPRAQAIVEGLVAQLAKVSVPSDQVDVLRAIANSGGVNAFDAVRPYLDAKPRSVQVAAIDALRLMARPEVDGIIAERLGRSDAEVQNAALDAISVRTPSTALASALVQSASSAVKPALRLKAVQIMAQWLPQRPELRTSLEGLADRDELEQIRQAAKGALGS